LGVSAPSLGIECVYATARPRFHPLSRSPRCACASATGLTLRGLNRKGLKEPHYIRLWQARRSTCQSPSWRGITNTPRHFLQNFEPPTTFSPKEVFVLPLHPIYFSQIGQGSLRSARARAERLSRRIQPPTAQVRTMHPSFVTRTECSACATRPSATSMSTG